MMKRRYVPFMAFLLILVSGGSSSGCLPEAGILSNLDGTLPVLEIGDTFFSDEVKVLEQLEKKVEKQIKETIGTTCKCKLVEPKSIQRSEGKAKRVTDKRNM